jgi:antitoxin YefM
LYSFPVHINREGCLVALKVSYSHARDNLAQVWDEVEDSREVAVISRRGHEDMALIPAAELSSLRETAYLLRSPTNAARLLAALTRARRGEAVPTDLDALRRELGLDSDE